MSKVLGIGKLVLKIAFVGLILAWGLVMNCVGVMICAITSGGK